MVRQPRLSEEYRELSRQVYRLRRVLLPRDLSVGGTFNSRWRQGAFSFRIHVHAELESYFEERFQEYINAVRGCAPPGNLEYVFIFFHQMFSTRISGNNGIKEDNLRTMFEATGFDFNLLPLGLLPNLNSYGAGRGNLAHNGFSRIGARRLPDPRGEWTTASTMLADLQTFDRLLTSYIQNL